MPSYHTFPNSRTAFDSVQRLCRHHDHLKTLTAEYSYMRERQTYALMEDPNFTFDQTAMTRLNNSYFTSLIIKLSESDGADFFANVKAAYQAFKDLVTTHHPNATVDIYFDSAHITIKSLLDDVQQNLQELSAYLPVVTPIVHKRINLLAKETKLYAIGLFTNLHPAKGLSIGIRFFPTLPLIQIIRGEVGAALYETTPPLPLRRETDFHTMLIHSTGFRARQLALPFQQQFITEFKNMVKQYDQVVFGSVDNIGYPLKAGQLGVGHVR